jgi:4-diphosphocytidyl-2-C-methyl-D-erythritol kinase
LETIFYPVPLKDSLEIIRATTDAESTNLVSYSSSGLTVDGEPANNLCVRAYHLLKAEYPTLPPIQMHLHKSIPMGAGLGGGSADATFTLQLLKKLFHLPVNDGQLHEMALQLGSDCPFFLYNQPCHATGRGEQLSPISLSLKGYQLVIINPGIHVNTGWAFKQLAENRPSNSDELPSLAEAIQAPISEWNQLIVNDFEVPVFKQYPEIEAVKNKLLNTGAIYAAMSGSGSSVWALFETNATLNQLEFPQNYLVKSISL